MQSRDPGAPCRGLSGPRRRPGRTDVLGVRFRAPDAAALAQLTRAHVLTVPFENVTSLLRRRAHAGGPVPPVDAEELLASRERGSGGGVCYEIAHLFGRLLAALGYRVHPVQGYITFPGSHQALLVDLEGARFLVDVGNGAPFFEPIGLCEAVEIRLRPRLSHVHRSRSWPHVRRHMEHRSGLPPDVPDRPHLDPSPRSRVASGGSAGKPGGALLVIEDDSALRDSLVEIIEAHGFDVRAASDGVEGLALLRGGLRPTAVLLDRWMPRLDGAGVLSAMAGDERLAKIPVVWMSGDVAAPPRDVSARLEKPFSVDDLLDLLRSLDEPD